jgi:DNA-binding transcriptional MerR regulator
VDEHVFAIDELAERAAAVLSARGTLPPSARVTAVPDRRMLRYYTTLGLLDRPLEVRGRTAYYGRRHLLQVVAIKRLQAEGVSLAEVQRRLAGASTSDLEVLAGMDAGREGASPPPRQFWQAHHPGSRRAAPAAAPAVVAAPAAPHAGDPVPTAIRLAPGVTLVVDAARPLNPDEHDGVRRAAAGLLRHLSALMKEH